MPTGDAAPNTTTPPRERRPSETPAENSAPTTPKQRTMTPKSSAITARTNYVSPYRQTPLSRSVSSPVAPRSASSGPANNASPTNFKNMINRFNAKQDEKIPNPSNQISAVVAARSRSRRQGAPKPAGERRNPPNNTGTAPATRGRQMGRPPSASSSNASSGSAPTARPPPKRAATENDRLHPKKGLPQLQTSFAEELQKKQHRRSLSALDMHSPSAASLADNEAESLNPTPSGLRHRRSRSNIEVSRSPTITVDADLAAYSGRSAGPKSPQAGRSGIPVSKSGSLYQLHTPDGSSPRTQRQASKAGVNMQVLTSPHGTRRPPQLSKSAGLSAYISAPLPKKSPPLRSTRQRLPAAANTSTHASRQRLQDSGSSSAKDVRSKKSMSFLQDKKKDTKRKIPELGTIDFAARRAKIQSAFTQSLKETDENRPRPLARSGSQRPTPIGSDSRKPSVDADYVLVEQEEGEAHRIRGHEGVLQVLPSDGETTMQAHPTDSVDHSPELHPGVRSPEQPKPNTVNDLHVEEPLFQLHTPVNGSGPSIANHLDMPGMFPTGDEQDPSVEEDEFLSAHGSPPRSVPGSPVSIVSERFSHVKYDAPSPFALDGSAPAPTKEELDESRPRQKTDADSDEPNAPIAVVITPDSPREATMFAQVSDALRASPIEWTDSELSGDSPITQTNIKGAGDSALSAGLVMNAPDVETIPETRKEHNTGRYSMDGTALSPMMGTASSDDRATIASFFNRYDEPREDFLDSYQASPVVERQQQERHDEKLHEVPKIREEPEETEWEDQSVMDHEDDPEEYDSAFHPDRYVRDLTRIPSRLERKDRKHSSPSDLSQSGDGWVTEVECVTSPEVEDTRPQQREPTVSQKPPSPSTPKRTLDLEDSRPPPPPPKDSPRASKKDPFKISPSSSVRLSPNTANSSQTFLPDIETDSEPLGLAIQALPSHYDFRPDRPSSYHTEQYYSVPRPSIDESAYTNSARTSVDQISYRSRTSVDQTSRASSEAYSRGSLDRPNTYRPTVEQYAPYRPSLETIPGQEHHSPVSSFYSEMEAKSQSSPSLPLNGRYASESAPASTTAVNTETPETRKEEKDPTTKRLEKRKHVMTELIETESSFFRDMTVVNEIYKGSASACSSLSLDDTKVIFGNTEAIAQFSKGFIDLLRHAAHPVYIPNRDKYGTEAPEKYDATPDELDRQTYIGEVFIEMINRMERVYADYCKNHDLSRERLAEVTKVVGISLWLEECRLCASDLTGAWDLAALLIKPVQRILKYPLLLKQLLDCTPNDHPDYGTLAVACSEISYVASRLNEMKRRREIVEKIVTGKKKEEKDIRHGISKSFARHAEKLRQSVGLSDGIVDDEYNRLFECYNMHFVQVQVVCRDIEIYHSEIGGHFERLVEFTKSFKDFGDGVPTHFPEVEAKWRSFHTAMRETMDTYLEEHKRRVRKHAIEPLEQLLKLHESPQIIMTKRNKKSVDFAKYKTIKERGDIPDKKTSDLADAYTALNETLIEELPTLFILTKKLVDAVLLNFIDLQVQWLHAVATKIRMTFTEYDIPQAYEDIIINFVGDYQYNEQVLTSLSICNGNLNAMQFATPQVLSTSSAMNSTEAFDTSVSSRPRTADPISPGGAVRDRALSLTSHSPTSASFDKTERRHSGGANLSPIFTYGTQMQPLPALLQPNNRNRANTAAAGASTQTPLPSMPPARRAYSTNLPESHAAAQASYFNSPPLPSTRPAMTRAQITAASLPHLIPRSEEPEPSPPLPSAAFSSAMPMDDDRAYGSRPPSRTLSRTNSTLSRSNSRTPSRAGSRRTPTLQVGGIGGDNKPMFVAASLYEFNIDKQRREAGFPYLTYVQGEIFDVIGIKGEIWLARNQDDNKGEIGWIWCKHFAKLPEQ